MDASFWSELSSRPLYLDQTDLRLTLDPFEVEKHILPLAHHLIGLPWRDARQMIAISGPPGCGKSSLAAILGQVINLLCHEEICAVVGQDGWHFSNHYLETHQKYNEGKLTPLRQLKGMPDTFDVAAMQTCLNRMKREEEVSFPIYSRAQHEPVADAGLVKREHRIILVEGNYLLLNRPGWKKLFPLFDLTISISAPLEVILAGLRQRHLRGGRDLQSIENHLRVVDIPDTQLIADRSKPADILIIKSDSQRIERIIYPPMENWARHSASAWS